MIVYVESSRERVLANCCFNMQDQYKREMMDSGIQGDDFNGRALQKLVQSMVLLEKCFIVWVLFPML